jgi:hypothetical protein
MDARKLAPDLEWVMHDILRRAEDASLYDCDGEKLTAAEAAYRAFTQRNELRRILEPLLANPLREIWTYSGPDKTCIFCEAHVNADYPFPPERHDSDCPVRQADRLLGRA